jgi:hypothetical protein
MIRARRNQGRIRRRYSVAVSVTEVDVARSKVDR